MQIAICDDIEQERREVVSCAEQYFSAAGQSYQITTFDSADKLLQTDKKFDLYLLDVLMPETDGMAAAKRIRAQYADAIIVFITSHLDSAVEGYRVEASGFLLKPLHQEAFDETMDHLMHRGLIGTQPVIHVVSKRIPMEIPLSKIIALESELHRVYVHMDGTVLAVNQRLADLEEQLEGHIEFLRCHQSFVINLRYVRELKENEFLLSSEVNCSYSSIPIARARLKFSKMAFYQYRLNRLS